MSTSNSLPSSNSGRGLRAAAGIVGLALLVLPGAVRAQDRIESSPPPGTSAPRPGVSVTGPRDTPPGGVEGRATGTARITGRVIRGDSGAPLRGAMVGAWSNGLPGGRSTITDADGRYELRELPAGRFFVAASKSGFVTVAHGQRRANEQGHRLELDGRRHIANIDITLPRGSVIAGRVTDEFGEPAANLSVAAMQYRYFAGRRQPVPAGMAHTDDRGRYRIFGLPPGEYVVSASDDGTSPGGAADPLIGKAPTYFPGSARLQDAHRVRLGVAEENASVNFAVLPARTVPVSGLVLDSAGARADAGYVMVLPEEAALVFGRRNVVPIGPDGTFAVGGLAPGDYTLHVSLGDGEAAEFASTAVSVGPDGVAGVTIVTMPGTIVAGHVTFEQTPPDSIKPSDFAFVLRAEGPTAPWQGFASFTPHDDWSFETLADELPVLVHGLRTPDGWTLKAVLHGGVDVIDSGLASTPGERISGVHLVISNRFGTVTGTVSGDQGRPVNDYTAVVFADDPARWMPMSRFVATARPDQRGTFEAGPLPPGRYLAAAVDYLEDGQQGDPEYLETLRRHATSFDVRDGERRTVELQLVHPE